MITIFKLDHDTLVIDGLTIDQSLKINNFVYKRGFMSFYTNSYIGKPNTGPYGKPTYQIVAQGSKEQLTMLKLLAENLEGVKAEKEPNAPKVMPAPKKVTVDEFVKAVSNNKMANCPLPWE